MTLMATISELARRPNMAGEILGCKVCALSRRDFGQLSIVRQGAFVMNCFQ